MKILILLLGFFLTFQGVFASGGGSSSSSKPLTGMYPIVLSHGLFGWGADSSGVISITDYWGGTDSYLRSQGVAVYSPTKSAAESNEYRAGQLKSKMLTWMAANGYNKVNIIGHSQGGLDSRYMIANLGVSGKVATLTTVNTPHYGSPVADVINAVIPSWLKPFVGSLIDTLVKIVYGGGKQDALAALSSLTKSGLEKFNSYTPNAAGVKYYSYGSYITIPDLIQHPLMGITYPACAAGGLAEGQGATCDGLVPLSSQKWGTWKGGPSYAWYVSGVDHLEASNSLYSGQSWYDVHAYYMKMAKNAKANQ